MKLLFKQRLFSWFDSYDIYDEAGNTAFVVKEMCIRDSYKAVLRALQGNDGGLRRHQQDRQAVSLLYVQKGTQKEMR